MIGLAALVAAVATLVGSVATLLATLRGLKKVETVKAIVNGRTEMLEHRIGQLMHVLHAHHIPIPPPERRD